MSGSGWTSIQSAHRLKLPRTGLSASIAIAGLCDCVPVEELAPDPVERTFGDYVPARSAGGWRVSCGCLSPLRRGLQAWRIKPEVMNILVQAVSTLPG